MASLDLSRHNKMCRSQESTPLFDGLLLTELELDTGHQNMTRPADRHLQELNQFPDWMYDSRAPRTEIPSRTGRCAPNSECVDAVPANVGSPTAQYKLEDGCVPAVQRHSISSPVNHSTNPCVHQIAPHFPSDLTEQNPRVCSMVHFAEASLLQGS